MDRCEFAAVFSIYLEINFSFLIIGVIHIHNTKIPVVNASLLH